MLFIFISIMLHITCVYVELRPPFISSKVILKNVSFFCSMIDLRVISKYFITLLIASGKSFIYSINKIEPNTLPWITLHKLDFYPSQKHFVFSLIESLQFNLMSCLLFHLKIFFSVTFGD